MNTKERVRAFNKLRNQGVSERVVTLGKYTQHQGKQSLAKLLFSQAESIKWAIEIGVHRNLVSKEDLETVLYRAVQVIIGMKNIILK